VIVGYAYVVGDILHVEHLRHLRNCRRLCDKLIVGVLTDEAAMEKKPRPTVPFLERMHMVEGIRWADAVVAQTTYLPLNNILMLEPDILFEHEKHEITQYPEFTGRVMVMPFSPGHSSTLIKEKIRGAS
jgi:cytidyltransferase-like protein